MLVVAERAAAVPDLGGGDNRRLRIASRLDRLGEATGVPAATGDTPADDGPPKGGAHRGRGGIVIGTGTRG